MTMTSYSLGMLDRSRQVIFGATTGARSSPWVAPARRPTWSAPLEPAGGSSRPTRAFSWPCSYRSSQYDCDEALDPLRRRASPTETRQDRQDARAGDQKPLQIQQMSYLIERLATVSTACHNTADLHTSAR